MNKYRLARLKKSSERINSRRIIDALLSEYTEENLQFYIKQFNEYL